MQRLLGVVVLLGFIATLCVPSHSTAEPAIEPIIFVNASATGSDDGSSWSDAFTDLQDALAAAQPGQSIWVASGIYKPTAGTDREISFEMKQGVAMFGGFEGNEDPETFDLADRDFESNETILSGDVLGNDNDNVAYDEPTREENSYTVVIGASDAVIDGFTVSGGNSNASDGTEYESPRHSGAGMYNLGSSPTVINCTFASNSSRYMGAGMFNWNNSSPAVIKCSFLRNIANSLGGGMTNWASSSPVVSDCTFAENSANLGLGGGGMCNYEDSTPSVVNCLFVSNTAASNGGGMFDTTGGTVVTNCAFVENYCLQGAGAMLNHSHTVIDCTFTDNTATWGGAMVTGSTAATINCIFTGNSARYGGAIYIWQTANTPTISSSAFISNSGNYGGGVCVDSSAKPVFSNCTFISNSATSGGGGIYNYDRSVLTVLNSVFLANSAEYIGGGIYTLSAAQGTITNCIFRDNTAVHSHPQVSNIDFSPNTVTYSNVQGGMDGEGNIDVDPLFADPDNGDFHLKSQYGRWDPADDGEGGWVFDDVTSPCIAAGDPDFDCSNEPQNNGGRVNMGIYGNTPFASKADVWWHIPGDAGHTCIVDMPDLIFIRNHIGQTRSVGDNWRADVNDDGSIDILDLVYARNRLGDDCIAYAACPTLSPAAISVSDSQVIILIAQPPDPDDSPDIFNIIFNGTKVLSNAVLDTWNWTGELNLDTANTVELEYVSGGSDDCITAEMILLLWPSGTTVQDTIRVGRIGKNAKWIITQQ